MEILRLTWRLQRTSVIGWSLVIFGLAWMTVAFYPLIADQYEQIYESLPPEFIDALVGDADPTTPEGYLSAEFLSYIPILYAVFAISHGGRVFAAEEEDGTLDSILSQPVGRVRFALEKAAATLSSSLVLSAAAAAGLLLGRLTVGVDLVWWRLVLLGLDLWPLTVLVYSLAFFGSALFHRRARAMLLATGYVVAAYFISIFAPLAPELEPLKYVSIFHFFRDSGALTGSLSATYWAVALVPAALFIAWGTWWFSQRDIYQ